MSVKSRSRMQIFIDGKSGKVLHIRMKRFNFAPKLEQGMFQTQRNVLQTFGCVVGK